MGPGPVCAGSLCLASLTQIQVSHFHWGRGRRLDRARAGLSVRAVWTSCLVWRFTKYAVRENPFYIFIIFMHLITFLQIGSRLSLILFIIILAKCKLQIKAKKWCSFIAKSRKFSSLNALWIEVDIWTRSLDLNLVQSTFSLILDPRSYLLRQETLSPSFSRVWEIGRDTNTQHREEEGRAPSCAQEETKSHNYTTYKNISCLKTPILYPYSALIMFSTTFSRDSY